MLTCSFYEATCESSVSDDVKESVVSDVIKLSYYHRENINTFFNNCCIVFYHCALFMTEQPGNTGSTRTQAPTMAEVY